MTDSASVRLAERVALPLPPSDTSLTLAGRTVTLRLHGDPAAKGVTAAVLHFHGGWFTTGTLDDGGPFASALSAVGAVVVSVGYPLAPEHPFPAAVDVGHAALQWLQARRGRRGGRVFVAGEEAGGNLAAAVAMMARDRDPGHVAGQILVSPLLDPCMGGASLRAASVGVGSCAVACGWQKYLAQPADITHPYAAPAAAVRLAEMPPALLVSIADHPLVDDARRYAARLTGAGVPVTEMMLPEDPRPSRRPWPEPVREALRRFVTEPAARVTPP